MDEYTPTTDNILQCYLYAGTQYDGSMGVSERVARAEFDRWHRADRVALIREIAFSGYFGTNAQSNLLRIAEIVAKGGGVPKA